MYHFSFFPAAFLGFIFFIFSFFYSSIFWYHFSSFVRATFAEIMFLPFCGSVNVSLYVCMYVGMYCDVMQCIIGTFTYVRIHVICMTMFRQTVTTRLIYSHLCACNHIYYSNIHTHTETLTEHAEA